MMNYGKHQIFIGGEKQDVIGFISAFLDKIENVEGYQIRIMLHVNDNDDIIRTDEEQIQEVMRSGKLRTQLSIHQTLMNPQTCLLQEQFDHAKVLLTLSIATSEHYCGKIVFQHLNRKKSNDNGIVLWSISFWITRSIRV